MMLDVGTGTIYVDRQGDTFHLTEYSSAYHAALTEMYDTFLPKAVTQGLPPANSQARVRWINELIKTGENFLAWFGNKIVGHASLLPEVAKKEAEYLIFVDQPYRNRGLGTQLTRMAIKTAQDLELEAVWLTVEALNFKAIKLYRKIGFVFVDTGERERTMLLRL